jgi:hypothetical protein
VHATHAWSDHASSSLRTWTVRRTGGNTVKCVTATLQMTGSARSGLQMAAHILEHRRRTTVNQLRTRIDMRFAARPDRPRVRAARRARSYGLGLLIAAGQSASLQHGAAGFSKFRNSASLCRYEGDKRTVTAPHRTTAWSQTLDDNDPLSTSVLVAGVGLHMCPALWSLLQVPVCGSARQLCGNEIRTADDSGRLPAYANSDSPATRFLKLGCRKAGTRHRQQPLHCCRPRHTVG